MSVNWGQVGPVLVSMGIILLIAVLRAFSKTAAAITATMPINIVLALWIVYAAEGGDPTTVVRFTESMFAGVGATAIFMGAVWLAARAGWELMPTLLSGYLAWGATLAVVFGLRQVLGG